MIVGNRKLQKINNSLFVNVPKIWTMNSNVERGDVVEMRIEEDGSLNIRIAPASPARQTDAAHAPECEAKA